ncbi:MAG: protein translocase subunit SecF [Anaerolineaceae bacterium]|nr:protein translocase subunit SecF [Anaerolineaceae bacterium]
MIDILGKRYLFFGISLVIIITGMVLLIVGGGLPFSIDFTGGSLLELRITEGSMPNTEDVVALFEDYGVTDLQVKTSTDTLIIQSQYIPDDERAVIIKGINDEFSISTEVLSADSVGPAIGSEVASRAAQAVGVAALGVIIYITFAFRGIAHATRFGVCAIVAMLHDVLIVVSVSAIGGTFLGWQFDSLTLTALLTVIGFSVQDKIVVFDRIRENTSIHRKISFEKLANHSIVQTLGRSINTQLMTSEFMLLALALLGGVTLREFAIILLVGLLSGTYSSIFIAAPILVIWENKEWETWFKKESAIA